MKNLNLLKVFIPKVSTCFRQEAVHFLAVRCVLRAFAVKFTTALLNSLLVQKSKAFITSSTVFNGNAKSLPQGRKERNGPQR
jgi:hypothetical protein